MREKVHHQLPLVAPLIEHRHAVELEAMSARLDALPEAMDLVLADLASGLKDVSRGRRGMSAETVLRALVVKQLRGFSYEELAFHLADSNSYRRLCRIGFTDKAPSASALQRDIKKIRAETIERVNRMLLGEAASANIEKGRMVRVDCTVTQTNIHQPSDSELLWDCNRVLLRLMARGHKLVRLRFSNRSLAARRRRLDILNAKGDKARRKGYVALLDITREVVAAAQEGVRRLVALVSDDRAAVAAAHALAEDLQHFADLARRVIDQTHRRVLRGERVPAQDKVLSIFEPHTDVIVKKRRETEYGHKLCIASGPSGLVTDLVVEGGNPADSTLALHMIERQHQIYGRPPRQVAFDGGFASKKNLADIKSLGVKDVAFSKRRGLKVLDMVKSCWVYQKLYRFRAGIEAGISLLKRCFGLDRCNCKGFASFRAYAWASVLAANLLTLARYGPA